MTTNKFQNNISWFQLLLPAWPSGFLAVDNNEQNFCFSNSDRNDSHESLSFLLSS